MHFGGLFAKKYFQNSLLIKIFPESWSLSHVNSLMFNAIFTFFSWLAAATGTLPSLVFRCLIALNSEAVWGIESWSRVIKQTAYHWEKDEMAKQGDSRLVSYQKCINVPTTYRETIGENYLKTTEKDSPKLRIKEEKHTDRWRSKDVIYLVPTPW